MTLMLTPPTESTRCTNPPRLTCAHMSILSPSRSPEGGGEHRLAVLGARELARVPADVRHEAVDLGLERATVRERHVHHVARDRDHRHGLADRVQRGDDHRVGERGVPPDAGVHADEQDVDARDPRRGRWRRGRRGGGRCGGGAWRRRATATHRSPKSGSLDSTGGAVWSGTQAPPSSTGSNTVRAASRASTVRFAAQSCGPTTMTTAATTASERGERRPERSRWSRPAPSADEPPQQEDGLQREQRPEDGGVDQAGSERGRRPRQDGDERRAADHEQHDQRRQAQDGGQRRRPAARWPRPGQTAVSRKSREAERGGASDRARRGCPGGRDRCQASPARMQLVAGSRNLIAGRSRPRTLSAPTSSCAAAPEPDRARRADGFVRAGAGATGCGSPHPPARVRWPRDHSSPTTRPTLARHPRRLLGHPARREPWA